MLPRFHAPHLAEADPSVTLDAEQSHHLARVLRLSEGDPVRVFDGRGGEWAGTVVTGDRRAATIGHLHPVTPLAEPPVRLTLLAAVLRGGAMDTLVHDATMTGVARLVPVLSARVSVGRRDEALRAAHARWQRVALAATRQCGRAVLPSIADPVPLGEALGREAAGVRLWLAEPTLSAGGLRRVDALAARARAEGAVLAIGPEGGWTEAEVAQARDAGFVPWSLGPLVLRAEHVPLAAMSVLRYAWD